MTQNRQILLMLFLFLAVGGVLFWLFFGNRATIIVTLEHENFIFDAKEYRRFTCEENSCRFIIPFGKREVCVGKEGYYGTCETLYLPWRKEMEWNPELKKIPIVVPAIGKQKVYKAPPPFEFTEETHELFYVLPTGERELVATLPGVESPHITTLQESAFLSTPTALYFVDSTTKRKYRVYEGEDFSVRALANTSLFLRNENELLLFLPETKSFSVLPFFAELEHIALCEEDTLLYAKNEDGKNIFSHFYPEKNISETLVEVRGLEEFGVQCGKNNTEIRLTFPQGGDQLIQW